MPEPMMCLSSIPRAAQTLKQEFAVFKHMLRSWLVWTLTGLFVIGASLGCQGKSAETGKTEGNGKTETNEDSTSNGKAKTNQVSTSGGKTAQEPETTDRPKPHIQGTGDN